MILPKPLGSRPIYKNQADFFRKAANRKKLKCPGNGMWTSLSRNKSLHTEREKSPRGTVRIASERGGSTVSRHIQHPPFKLHSRSVHILSMHGSRAIHMLITCHPCPVHVLIMCHSHPDREPSMHHSRADQVPSTLCSHVIDTVHVFFDRGLKSWKISV